MDKRTRITDKQLKALYTIGHVVSGLNADQVDSFCIELYRCVPADLTKAQASQALDLIKVA